MKTYLIDGYNLGHKIPQVKQFLNQQNFAAAIEAIIQAVQQRLNSRKNRVIIVFDGKRGVFASPAGITSIEIKFSRKPQEADDVIRQYLRRAKDTSDIVVISSDRAIINSARDLGAQALTSEEFYFSKKQKKSGSNSSALNEKPDPEQVDLDYWLEQFKQRDDEDL